MQALRRHALHAILSLSTGSARAAISTLHYWVRPVGMCRLFGFPAPSPTRGPIYIGSKEIMRGRCINLLFASAILAFPVLTSAQAPSSSPATQAQIATLQQSVQNAQMNADNAWMLVSAALVLLMTGPGLALFYGGLVRRKNVLATLMQSFTMMAMVTILWALYGYSFAFAKWNFFIGDLHFGLLRNVGSSPNLTYAPTIPHQTFMIYQLMFAIITPALITGAFAERMKFSAMLLFLILWSLFVYDPMAPMVWGKGGLLNASLGGRFPTLDFAGGTVVHVTSGVS